MISGLVNRPHTLRELALGIQPHEIHFPHPPAPLWTAVREAANEDFKIPVLSYSLVPSCQRLVFETYKFSGIDYTSVDLPIGLRVYQGARNWISRHEISVTSEVCMSSTMTFHDNTGRDSCLRRIHEAIRDWVMFNEPRAKSQFNGFTRNFYVER